MLELHFDTIARVLETWDAARRRCKDFDAVFGERFVGKFVELQPRVKQHYGFNKNKTLGEMMLHKHARNIVGFFDSVLQVLGPDAEFIEEILHSVGERHAKLGVSPCYFPYLGNALLWALEDMLGPDQFTRNDREAWEDVYEMMSTEMMKAILETNP